MLVFKPSFYRVFESVAQHALDCASALRPLSLDERIGAELCQHERMRPGCGLTNGQIEEFFLQCQSVSFVAVPPSPRFSFSRKRWKVDPHGMWSTASLSLSVCGCRGLELKSNVKSEQQDQLPKTDRSAKNPYPNHSSSRLFFEEPVPVTTEHQVHDPPAGPQGSLGRADPRIVSSRRAGSQRTPRVPAGPPVGRRFDLEFERRESSGIGMSWLP